MISTRKVKRIKSISVRENPFVSVAVMEMNFYFTYLVKVFQTFVVLVETLQSIRRKLDKSPASV